MSDLTPHERETLVTRLRDGVPEAPELTDLATAAETHVRRVRRIRGVGAVLAAAVAVAAVVTVPRLVGHDDPPASPSPTQCVARSHLDHRDFRIGTVTWVRACPPSAREVAIPLPTGVVRGQQAEDLALTWQESARLVSPAPFCPVGSRAAAAVQVGFADGTVAEIHAGSCWATITPGSLGLLGMFPSDLADAYAVAAHRENDRGYPTYSPTRPPRKCPKDLSHPAEMNIDGRSADGLSTTGALLNLTADESLVCRYDQEGRLERTHHDRDSERLLLASSSAWVPNLLMPRRKFTASYLVSLRDKTDTWRTFTVTGRLGRVTLYRDRGPGDFLGYAGSLMYHELSGRGDG